MRVTIVRFKKYLEQTVREFNVNELTLLDGESGMGKTTILEAVLWCLYGKMNHIYSSGTTSTSKSQTCVLIEFPELGGLYIRRTKPPEVVEVGVPVDGKYSRLTSGEADAYIETFFGPKDLFITSSYIQQSSRCPLITGSNSDKTQLLQQLTFGSGEGEKENSEMYLKRINNELISLKQTITSETGKYNGLGQAYQAHRHSHEAGYLKWESREDKTKDDNAYMKEKEEGEAHIKEIDLEFSTLTKALVEKASLEKQLSSIIIKEPSFLEGGKENTEKMIEALTELIITVKEQAVILAELEKYRKGLADLDDPLLKDLTPEKIEELRLKKEKIQEQLTVAKSLGIEYTVEAKIAFLSEIESKLNENDLKRVKKDEWIALKEKLISEWKLKVKAENERVDTENTEKMEAYNKEVEVQRLQMEEVNDGLKKEYDVKVEAERLRVDEYNLKMKEEYDLKVEVERQRVDSHNLKLKEEYDSQIEECRKDSEQENDRLKAIYEKEIEAYSVKEKEYAEKMATYKMVIRGRDDYNLRKKAFDEYITRLEAQKAKIDVDQQSIAKLKDKIRTDHLWYHDQFVKDGETADFGHLERNMQKLHALKSQLRCPHCDNALIYDDGKLKKGEVTEGSLHDCEEKIAKIIAYARDLMELQKLESNLQASAATLEGFTSIEPPSPHPGFDTSLKEPEHHGMSLPTLASVKSEALPQPVYIKAEPIPQPAYIKAEPIPQPAYIKAVNVEKPQVIIPNEIPESDYGIEPIVQDDKEWFRKKDTVINLEIIEGSIPEIDRILEKASMIPHIQSIKDHIVLLESKVVSTEEKRTPEELEIEKNTLKQKLRTYNKEKMEYDANLKRKSEIEAELVKYKSVSQIQSAVLESEKVTLRSLISTAYEMLMAFASHSIIKSSYEAIELQKRKLLEYTEYESNVNKLKVEIQEVASQAMEETIDALNAVTNQVLREIFIDDIQVVLRTHKELKSKDVTKLQVNLQVNYRGNLYDSPARLSGGEQDRVSLALTLAMARVSGSPILMLDECMSSLSEDLQEACLEMIQAFAKDKTIIHICHRATKGQHDNVLGCCQDEDV